MKTVNIYDFFPVADDETMNRYLKKDSEYEDRKNQLAHLLIKCVPDEAKKFPAAMLNCVFDPEYIATHRWPTIKWVNLTECISAKK